MPTHKRKADHFDTSARRGVFDVDELLRKHGFSIVDRPRSGQAVWKRFGDILYTEQQALAFLDRIAMDEIDGITGD